MKTKQFMAILNYGIIKQHVIMVNEIFLNVYNFGEKSLTEYEKLRGKMEKGSGTK